MRITACILVSSLLVQATSAGQPAQTEPTAKPEPAPKTPFQIAEAHFKAREYAQAERLVTEQLNTNPGGPEAAASYYLLGHAMERQNKLDEAIRTLSGCVARFPGTEAAAQSLDLQATIHLQRKNAGVAKRLHDQLLSEYPKSPTTLRIWAGNADGLFREGKFAEALAIYERLDGELPAKTQRNIGAARILAERGSDPQRIMPVADQILADGDRELAAMLYEELVKSPSIGRDLPLIQTRLAWCLSLLRNEESRDRAVKLWQEVIRSTRPSDAVHAEAKWHLVRHAAGPERDWKKAVNLCDDIIAAQTPGSFRHEQAMFSKAWLLTVHNQGEAAVEAFDRFAAAYPEKAAQPPVVRHRERALESASKKSNSRR
jgi:tetratricopeptide (TPR) repeat protein